MSEREVDAMLRALGPLADDVLYRVERRSYAVPLDGDADDATLAMRERLARAMRERDEDAILAAARELTADLEPLVLRASVATRNSATMQFLEQSAVEVMLSTASGGVSLRRLSDEGARRQLTLSDPPATRAGDAPFEAFAPLPILPPHIDALRERNFVRRPSPTAATFDCECAFDQGTLFRFRVRRVDQLPLRAGRFSAKGDWYLGVELNYGPMHDGPLWVTSAAHVSVTIDKLRRDDRSIECLAIGTAAQHLCTVVAPDTLVIDARQGHTVVLGHFDAVRASLPSFVTDHFTLAKDPKPERRH